ncbi:hypothetical protein [Chitinophaga sp. CB10]|uniref:hypothetical protein n=1 Tax=Chitinophaga sp. CB10 TaxID=1891659 RepID=UPI0025B7FA00|nr:hypothetical protein [Chitinophaga sp. CB10]
MKRGKLPKIGLIKKTSCTFVSNQVLLYLELSYPFYAMKIFKYLAFAMLCSMPLSILAQEDRTSIPRVIGPSPNAASIAKYGEVPVSNYTGTVNVSVPIFTVKNKEITVPISLNYHSGGIKVQEEASLVGLGWSLFTGGVISRVVRGTDDLSTYGYMYSYMPQSVSSNYLYVRPTDNNAYNRDMAFLNDAISGIADGEPDIFSFTINGASGKFILNKGTAGTPITATLLSKADVKISVSYNAAIAGYSWIITDAHGMQYYFGTSEINTARTAVSTEELQSDLNVKDSPPKETVTSWYLDKIISPTGAEVNFNYFKTSPGAAQVLSRSQIKRHIYNTQLATLPGGAGTCPIGNYHEFLYFSSYSEIQEVYLKSITFPAGKVEFNHSTREDIEPVVSTAASMPLKLDNISIYSREDGVYTFKRRFEMQYSYFGGGDYLTKRLKLLSVRETDGIKPKAPFTFNYNAMDLPAKNSKAIDHWGYYNGASNNAIRENTNNGDHMANGTLVPPVSIYYPATQQTGTFIGANREPNPQFSQACMLTSLTYPTGGTTTFTYEPNDYYAPETIKERVEQLEYLHKKGPQSPVMELQPNEMLITMDSVRDVTVQSHWSCYFGDCMNDEMDIEYDAFEVYKINGTSQMFVGSMGILINSGNQSSADAEQVFTLDPGTYKIKALCEGGFFNWITVSFFKTEERKIKERYGPGLRIKALTNYDGVNHANDVTTKYSYETIIPGDSIRSSGVLMSDPVYTYTGVLQKMCTAPPDWPISYEVISSADAVFRESTSIMPISASAAGSPLGYTEVTESRTNAGKTVYIYHNNKDQINYPTFPNVPLTSDPENGQLLHQYIYANQPDGSFKLIKRISRNYQTDGTRRTVIRGVKIPEEKFATYEAAAGVYMRTFENVKFYDMLADFTYLSAESVVEYSPTGSSDSLITTTIFEYGHPTYLQLTKSSTINSKNQQENTTFKYPFDYPADPVLQNMVNAFRVGDNIETKKDIDGVPVKTVRTNYTSWPGNKILPVAIIQQFHPDAAFTAVDFLNYDSEGNILTQAKHNDVPSSYKWGYDNQFPVAEVVNANSSQFYYESFEYGVNKGIAQVAAKTGSMVKPSGFQVNFTVPDQRGYVLTYWYRNGSAGNWIMKTLPYTGPTYTITDGAYIDEVRIYPADATMKTFTYDPLCGMTSATNESNITVYYLYDGYGQLIEQRDHNYNILKVYEYRYQAPVN